MTTRLAPILLELVDELYPPLDPGLSEVERPEPDLEAYDWPHLEHALDEAYELLDLADHLEYADPIQWVASLWRNPGSLGQPILEAGRPKNRRR